MCLCRVQCFGDGRTPVADHLALVMAISPVKSTVDGVVHAHSFHVNTQHHTLHTLFPKCTYLGLGRLSFTQSSCWFDKHVQNTHIDVFPLHNQLTCSSNLGDLRSYAPALLPTSMTVCVHVLLFSLALLSFATASECLVAMCSLRRPLCVTDG